MSFINKKALFLLITVLVFLPFVSFALTIGDCSKFTGQSCTYKISDINIGTLDDDDILNKNTLLGDLNSGDIISIKWNGQTTDNLSYFYLKYGCSTELDLKNDDYKLTYTIKNSTWWTVPSQVNGCQKDEDCYCKIWIWAFNQERKPIGIFNSKPFRIWQGGGESIYQQGVVNAIVKQEYQDEFSNESFVWAFEKQYDVDVEYLSSLGIVVLKNQNRDILNQISSLMYFESVSRSLILEKLDTPNDPYFNLQYSLNNDGGTVNGNNAKDDADMDVVEAWDLFKGNKDIIVAVIDDGVVYSHEDLKANMWDGSSCIAPDNSGKCPYHGWDFASNDNNPMPETDSHGTHIAGIIGGVANNSKGISGVNQEVSIMALKTSNGSAGMGLDAILKAIDFAIKNKANIINASLGTNVNDQSLKRAIEKFVEIGGLFVSAAGNDGVNNEVSPTYPCSYNIPGAMCIGASGPDDTYQNYSNYGKSIVDISAPGTDIYSTVMQGYQYMNGTSMATPNAIGVAALVWGKNPSYTNIQVKNILLETGDLIQSHVGKTRTGKRINALNALKGQAQEPAKQKPTIVTESYIFDKTGDGVTLKASAWIKEEIPVRIKYWFEVYQRDSNFEIIESTRQKFPAGSGTIMTKNDISSMPHIGHASFSAYTSYDTDNIMCFVPYGKIDISDEYPVGQGAELCFPDIPWVITKPAQNIKENKADFSGIITYWAKQKKLNVWFRLNDKDLDKILINNTGGDDFARHAFFLEGYGYKPGDCYQACAQVPGEKKYNCGVKWCFEGEQEELSVETVKYKQADEGVSFVGKVNNYNNEKLLFGFKVYVKGESNLVMDVVSIEHNVLFDSNSGIFTIMVPNLVFEKSGYCFKAYVKETSEILADNEICSEQEEDDEDQDNDNNQCNIAFVQAGMITCGPCQKQKAAMQKIAQEINGEFIEINADEFDAKVLQNKKRGLFVYMPVDDSSTGNYALLRKYADNYDIGNGVPFTILFQSGKDIDSMYGFSSTNGEATIKQKLNRYCP